MKMKNTFYVKALLLLILINASIWNTACKKGSPCEGTEVGPTYELSNESKEYFGNYNDASLLIFENSLGEEVILNVSEITERNVTYGFGKLCEEDNSLHQYVEGQSQIASLLLSSSEFIKPFYLQIVEHQDSENRAAYEAIEVYFGSLPDLEDGDGLFSYSISGENFFVIIEESLEINGVVYSDVISIEDPFAIPKFEIKITKEEGIVYIKDKESGVEYFYNRKE